MAQAIIEDLRLRVGKNLGLSSWVPIDQDRIEAFATATSDPDPMHIDPAWSRAHSPFGDTIAFGFLTMSLLTALYRDALGLGAPGDDGGHGLNYGFNRLRLVAPVPTGSRVRGRFALKGLEPRAGNRILMTIDAVVEIEGQDKPALVAEWLTLWIPGDADG